MPSPFLILKIALAFLAGLAAAGPLGVVADRLAARRSPSQAGSTTVEPASPTLTTLRIVTGIVFAVLAARFEPAWQLGPYLALAAVLIVLSIVDAVTHRLPNVIVWPSIAVGLVVVAVLSGLHAGVDRFAAALVGAALFAGIIGATHLTYPRGMGRGDIKLTVLLGLAIGWSQSELIAATVLVVYALIACSFLGLVHALRFGALTRPNQPVPFGPALVAGSLLVIVGGPHLVP